MAHEGTLSVWFKFDQENILIIATTGGKPKTLVGHKKTTW